MCVRSHTYSVTNIQNIMFILVYSQYLYVLLSWYSRQISKVSYLSLNHLFGLKARKTFLLVRFYFLEHRVAAVPVYSSNNFEFLSVKITKFFVIYYTF